MLAPRQYWGVLAVGLLSGLVGGVLAERWLAPDSAWAQLRQKVIYSEEFLLVDKNGKPRGGLGLGTDGSVGLTLAGRDGIKTLYISPDDPHVLRLADKSGKTLWALP